MKDKPKFTNEELFYIEKIMDINATQGIAWLEKYKLNNIFQKFLHG